MSRPPLIRAGTGNHGLHTHIRELQRQQAELDRMIRRATDQPDLTTNLARRSPAGDEHRLRGIPLTAKGIPGHQPGTRPDHHTW